MEIETNTQKSKKGVKFTYNNDERLNTYEDLSPNSLLKRSMKE